MYREVYRGGDSEMRAALVARADQQHAWVLAGDDRGIYGDYPPKRIAIDAGSIARKRLCTSEAVSGLGTCSVNYL
jgi:hypothetical protein